MGVINLERNRVKCLYKRAIKARCQDMTSKKQRWLAYKLMSSDVKGFWKGWRSIKNVHNKSYKDVFQTKSLEKKYVRVLKQHFRRISLILGLMTPRQFLLTIF